MELSMWLPNVGFKKKGELVMVSKKEILEKEKELDALKKEYMEERPPCMNKECGWFRETGHTNNCSWTVFHDECGEYKE